ncbi:helix-turn-helix domain-containing protein [Synechocystis salina]|uniref:Transcriptional regulator n=1 Tax=Synechocystis salina LEGE 00031 TaxID=1828736 RepID=A0ABR9VR84_9SYNC|nr:transcriptional regulator [Synechocystis salina]MBE9242945.1 transcriptional regulator [Synechocystis salina LEGE 00041]MBE9253861.1 transcriptional regulator [Synechocystis salina LEGE 00031]
MSVSESYRQLLAQFPARPINTEEELDATQAVIDQLLDKPELTPDEADYLDLLGTLVYDYEQQQDLMPDIYGVELLKVLIEERGLKQKELVPIFKTESIVSDILRGNRQLTTRHIQELSAYFHLSPAVFFPAVSSSAMAIA